MNTNALVRALAEQSDDLSRDLDSFSDRAYELQRLAKALAERAGRQTLDKATQCETTAVGAPAYELDRAKRLAPFAFASMDRKLNWRRLRALNVDRVVRETDTRALVELYGDLAYADLERESVYDMSEANLLKLVRVLQLLLQLQQHQLEQSMGVAALLREETVQTVGVLRMLPHLEVKGVAEGLSRLQGDFYKVADADMDAMFAQVRTEERTGARDVVGQQVDQVKQALDLNAFGGGGGGGVSSSAHAGGSGEPAAWTGGPGGGAPGVPAAGPQSRRGVPKAVGLELPASVVPAAMAARAGPEPARLSAAQRRSVGT